MNTDTNGFMYHGTLLTLGSNSYIRDNTICLMLFFNHSFYSELSWAVKFGSLFYSSINNSSIASMINMRSSQEQQGHSSFKKKSNKSVNLSFSFIMLIIFIVTTFTEKNASAWKH